MKRLAFAATTLLLPILMAESHEEEQSEDIQVMAIKKNDPDFLEGTKEAIRTIDLYLDLHEQHKDNLGVYFAIKFGVPDDGDQTYLWYNFEKEENGKLFAYHYNMPESLKAFEKISISKEEISDWMINDHGHLIGGWSVRLYRLRLPEEKREEFDEQAGITIYKENEF